MTELKIALQPKQLVFRDTIESTPTTFYGGAKGGGKSKGMRLILLYRRFLYPGSYGAIFRKTFPELDANHIRPLLEEYPSLREYWHESKKLLSLPNGSTLQFCHCATENDVDLYQGREFHDLGIDEVGQWTESAFRKLQGSNRSSKPGIKARTILTGNPGGPGHKWLKRLFIEHHYKERERPEDYAFIQALVDDNPALIQNDPDYVHRLESLTNEALRKAYRYGSWDIFSGQFYNEINREIHVVPAFTIPEHWNRFGAYDYGFNHPAAFGWFATNEDGDVYMYREFCKAQMRVDQFATVINSYPDTKDLMYVRAGWDCWAKKAVLQTGTSPTIAEEFVKHGIILSKANIDRVQGAAQVRQYLAWQNLSSGRKRPRLFLFDNCPITFDCLTRMEHDPNRVEDVLKVDAVEGDPLTGDDSFDMLRYGVMSRPAISDHAKPILIPGSHEHAAHMASELERNVVEKLTKEKEKRDVEYGSWNDDKDPSGVPLWNRW